MSKSPAWDIADILAEAEVLNESTKEKLRLRKPVFAEDLFIGREPSEPTPAITIYDTPGGGSELPVNYTGGSTDIYERLSVQVRVRSKDYPAAMRTAQEIQRVLDAYFGQVNNSLYMSVRCSLAPAVFDWQENEICRVVASFQIMRKPIVGGAWVNGMIPEILVTPENQVITFPQEWDNHPAVIVHAKYSGAGGEEFHVSSAFTPDEIKRAVHNGVRFGIGVSTNVEITFARSDDNVYSVSAVNGLLVEAILIGGAVGRGGGEGLTPEEAAKLAGIEDGAQVNVPSDWAQTDATKDSFIRNKPNISASGSIVRTAVSIISANETDDITVRRNGVVGTTGNQVEIEHGDLDGDFLSSLREGSVLFLTVGATTTAHRLTADSEDLDNAGKTWSRCTITPDWTKPANGVVVQVAFLPVDSNAGAKGNKGDKGDKGDAGLGFTPQQLAAFQELLVFEQALKRSFEMVTAETLTQAISNAATRFASRPTLPENLLDREIQVLVGTSSHRFYITDLENKGGVSTFAAQLTDANSISWTDSALAETYRISYHTTDREILFASDTAGDYTITLTDIQVDLEDFARLSKVSTKVPIEKLPKATGTDSGIIGPAEYTRIHAAIDATHLHDVPMILASLLEPEDAILFDKADIEDGQAQIREIRVDQLDKRWKQKVKGVGALPTSLTDYEAGDAWLVPSEAIYEAVAGSGRSATFSIAGLTPTTADNQDYAIPVSGIPGVTELIANAGTITVKASPGTFGHDGLDIVIGDDSYYCKYEQTVGGVDDFFATGISGLAWTTSPIVANSYIHSRSTKPFTATGLQWSRALTAGGIIKSVENPLDIDHGGKLSLAPAGITSASQIGEDDGFMMQSGTGNQDWFMAGIPFVKQALGINEVEGGNTFPANPHVNQRFRLLREQDLLENDKEAIVRADSGQNAGRNSLLINNTHSITSYPATYAGGEAAAYRGKTFFLPSGQDRASHVRVNGTSYAVAATTTGSLALEYEIIGLTPDDLVVGTKYKVNAQIKPDGTWIYPPTNYAPGDYTYRGSPSPSWVYTPGVAASWASQGNPPPVSNPVVILHSGSGTGITVTNSSQNKKLTAPVGFTPAFDLDDKDKQVGTIQVDASFELVNRGSNDVGFNSGASASTAVITGSITGFRFASQVRASADYSGTEDGIRVGSISVYKGSTLLGEIELYLAHDANNILGYHFKYEGANGNVGFAVSVTELDAAFIHNDSVGGAPVLVKLLEHSAQVTSSTQWTELGDRGEVPYTLIKVSFKQSSGFHSLDFDESELATGITIGTNTTAFKLRVSGGKIQGQINGRDAASDIFVYGIK